MESTDDRLLKIRHSHGPRDGRGGAASCSRAPAVAIGPAIEDGFYYDFDLPRAADDRGPGEIEDADERDRRRAATRSSGRW